MLLFILAFPQGKSKKIFINIVEYIKNLYCSSVAICKAVLRHGQMEFFIGVFKVHENLL